MATVRAAIVVGIALASAACAAPLSPPAARSDFVDSYAQELVAQCEKAHPDRLKKPVSPRVTCLNAALRDYARMLGGRDNDIMALFTTRRAVVAERYDAGKMTPAEYEAEMAKLEYELSTDSRHRDVAEAEKLDRQNQQIAHQNSMAAAAVARGLQDFARSVNPPTSTTNCQMIGHIWQCKTW